MCYKRINSSLWWNLVRAFLVFPINYVDAFSYSRLSGTRKVTNLPQINVGPTIHTNKENLTIFELVMIRQLQEIVDNSIGVRRFTDPFWISTSFLTNLLDSSQWSIRKAKRKIQKAINWRNNNADIFNQLPNQNLFDYYDLEIKGFDKEGCPVVIIPFGKWRTYRSYVEKIKSISAVNNNLRIYFLYMMEKIMHQIRSKQDSECSQFTVVADMDHYNIRHTSGIKFFIETIKLLDRVYPGLLKIAYVINSSPHFLKVAKTYKSEIPWDLRRKSFLYSGKSFWKEAILQNIDASELALRYGGTNFFLE